jgi:hypothetical protein
MEDVHAVDELRLAGEVGVVGAGLGGARGDERLAVLDIRPTVVITTRADTASSLSEAGSSTSAWRSGTSARAALSRASRLRRAASFFRLRPASDRRVSAGACCVRYSAVRAPVNPVAPKSTMSWGRSAATKGSVSYGLAGRG